QIFTRLFNSRKDWDAKGLTDGLLGCWFTDVERAANANAILDYWVAHEKVLGPCDSFSATYIMKDFLKRNRADLAGRVIGLLSEQVPFHYMKEILLEYSTPQ